MSKLIIFLIFQLGLLSVCPAELLKHSDFKETYLYKPMAESNHGVFGWVCGRSRDAKFKFKCDDLGLNEAEGYKEEFQIVLDIPNVRHEYGLRHGIQRSECRRIKSAIEKLVRGSKEFCIRGNLAEQIGKSSSVLAGWVFDEFRTDKGAACEFNGCFKSSTEGV